MAVKKLIQAKMHRLQELRRYQAYYGPNTPYPVVLEINDLEIELRQLLQKSKQKPAQFPKQNGAGRAIKKKQSVPLWQFWHMSQATFDAIVAITFVSFLFLLAVILFVAYLGTRPSAQAFNSALGNAGISAAPTLRPTFTPTSEMAVADQPVAEAAVSVDAHQANLPPAVQEPTPVPTAVPSLTPTPAPLPTNTPLPTDTPLPTPTAPPPPAQPTATTALPTPTAAPSFPFAVAEQGNRAFQKTTYNVITVYAAIVSSGNIPMGGYRVIASNSQGGYVESEPSEWFWSVANCLDCGYVKQGNLKMDLGPYTDSVWTLQLVDGNGSPVAQPLSLSYGSDPEQWVWDFVLFKQN